MPIPTATPTLSSESVGVTVIILAAECGLLGQYLATSQVMAAAPATLYKSMEVLLSASTVERFDMVSF